MGAMGGCCFPSSLRQRADGFAVRGAVSLPVKGKGQVGAVEGGGGVVSLFCQRQRAEGCSGGFCCPLGQRQRTNGCACQL